MRQVGKYNAALDVIARARKALTTNEDACVERNAMVHGNGYTVIRLGSRSPRLTHRVVYEQVVGPIPPGLHVLHKCDNRKCFNPRHLFTGTHQDNMDDMRAKGRFKHPIGEGMGMKKLTAADIPEIRRRSTLGETQKSIAASYHVDPSAISNVVRRRNWAHIL